MAADGKVFVGGLSRATTDYGLSQYFSQYGSIKECVVPKTPDEGVPRGFGFVTFEDPQAAIHATSTLGGMHVIDGKQVEAKPCTDRRAQLAATKEIPGFSKPSPQGELDPKKVFIGGLPLEATEDTIRDVFTAYGPVSHVVIMMDTDSGRSKGFGFVTFMAKETCDRVVQEHFITVLNKKAEVKQAVMTSRPPFAGMNHRGRDGGFGGMNARGGMQGRKYGAGDGYGHDYQARGMRPQFNQRQQNQAYMSPQQQWVEYASMYGQPHYGDYPPEAYGSQMTGCAFDPSGFAYSYPLAYCDAAGVPRFATPPAQGYGNVDSVSGVPAMQTPPAVATLGYSGNPTSGMQFRPNPQYNLGAKAPPTSGNISGYPVGLVLGPSTSSNAASLQQQQHYGSEGTVGGSGDGTNAAEASRQGMPPIRHPGPGRR